MAAITERIRWPWVKRSRLEWTQEALRLSHQKYAALHARCLMAEGWAVVNEPTIEWVREHFDLYDGPPGYAEQNGRDNAHESDGTVPEACDYCGDVWPCAASTGCTGDPCTCANGIGCVNIPVDQW